MQIVVYTKSERGVLSRNVVNGFDSVDDFRAYYDLAGEGDPEKLVGWPESKVVWYGNTGIAQ
jgi:hypothetical protein